MEFTVPQFIEREPKIVGPFTFKQFIFIGIAGGICLFLFFATPLYIFIIAAIVLLGGAFALAFLKIGKTSLPVFIKNFFSFLFKPKIYLWKKKTSPPKFLRKEEVKVKEEEEIEQESKLKVSSGSRLDELFTRIETK
ncbi:PrgI family protein [Patescibacteria group bacterium]|nr:PrgI family protein [Patescibacteria group bacterium]